MMTGIICMREAKQNGSEIGRYGVSDIGLAGHLDPQGGAFCPCQSVTIYMEYM